MMKNVVSNNTTYQGGVDSKKLIKNSFYSAISTFGDLLLFGLTILAGNYLGVESFGIFSFAAAFSYIFAVAVDFGLDRLTVREVARDKGLAKSYIGNILIYKFLVSLVAFGLLALAVTVVSSSPVTRSVTYLIGISTMLKTLTLATRSFYQAYERFDLEAVLVVVDRFALFAIGAGLLVAGGDVVALAWVFAIVRLVGFLFALGLLYSKVSIFHFKFDVQFIKKYQITALPFGFSFLCFILYNYLDIVIIQFTNSAKEVGLYNSSYQIYMGAMLLPTILGPVMYSRLSNLFLVNKDLHFDLLVRNIRYNAILAIPITVVGFLYSYEIIHIFFGASFSESSMVLRVLLLGIYFGFQNTFLHVFLDSSNQHMYKLYIAVASLVIRVAFGLILIPIYDSVGAAMAAGISVFAMFLAYYIFLSSREYRLPVLSTSIKPLCATIVTSALLWSVFSLSLFPFAILFIPLYGALLILFNTFDKAELKMLQQVFLRPVLRRS